MLTAMPTIPRKLTLTTPKAKETYSQQEFTPSTLTPHTNQNIDLTQDYFTKGCTDKSIDLWLQELIPTINSNNKNDTKLIAQVEQHGIPMALRGRVW